MDLFSVRRGVLVSLAGFLFCLGGMPRAQQTVPLDEAARLQREADALIEKAQYNEAAERLERALSLRRQNLGEKHPDVAQSLSRLGTVAFYQGNYPRAEQLFQDALNIREATLAAQDVAIADSLTDLASVFQVRGDYVRPEPLYLRALAIYEKATATAAPPAPVLTYMGDALENLGALYQRRGDFVRAESNYLRALKLRESTRGPDHPSVAATAGNLGGVYYASAQYDKAMEVLKRAVAIQEKNLPGSRAALATSSFNLAAVYFDQGDYANAEPLFRRALEIDEELLDARHPRLAVRLNGLAEVLRLRGEYQRAEPLYERVQSIREQTLGGSHPQVADAWIARSLLRYASGDFAGAAALLSRGSELREETLALVLTAGSEDAKRQYLSKIADETDIAVSLHLGAAPESATAATLALNDIVQRKGRSLDAMADQFGNLRRRLDAADQDVLRQLSAARGRLAGLVLNGISTAAQQEAAAKLRSEIETHEQTISARSADFSAASRVATLGDIQEAMPAGSVLIEFASYRPFNVHKSRTERFAPLRYAVYVLSKTGIVVSVDLGEAARIDRDVERFRRTLATPANQDARAAGRALHQTLIQPIEASIRGVEHVFVAPDGPLNLIPFAALVRADGTYLIESHTLSYVTSGRDFMRLRGPANPSRTAGPPVVVANPSFDRGNVQASSAPDDVRLRFPPLPGTMAEAEALAKELPDARIYTGGDATETLLKEMRTPSVLHIATHGFFLRPTGAQSQEVTRGLSIVPPPLATGARRDDALVLSGLALAGANQRAGGSGEDGILTALEAASLDLWGTRLVVLSACETGVGDARNGEGVYGLRRALVLAGSESQVMSLWQVSDTATTDLMIGYYQRLRAGEGRAQALRNVQRRFLQGGSNRSHPFYWASFIQSGDWRALFN